MYANDRFGRRLPAPAHLALPGAAPHPASCSGLVSSQQPRLTGPGRLPAASLGLVPLLDTAESMLARMGLAHPAGAGAGQPVPCMHQQLPQCPP